MNAHTVVKSHIYSIIQILHQRIRLSISECTATLIDTIINIHEWNAMEYIDHVFTEFPSCSVIII